MKENEGVINLRFIKDTIGSYNDLFEEGTIIPYDKWDYEWQNMTEPERVKKGIFVHCQGMGDFDVFRVGKDVEIVSSESKSRKGVKRITVSMLEAHFNAEHTLLDYVKKEARNGCSRAKEALKDFALICEDETPRLDPVEAVFGFAAMLSNLDPMQRFGVGEDKTKIAILAGDFANANTLGVPAPGYGSKLKFPKVK